MLTQMELMHNVVDLDRPISIHGEQIAETLIIRPMRSVSLSNLLSLFSSRDRSKSRFASTTPTYRPTNNTTRDVVPLSRAMYLRDRNNTTPDPTTRGDEAEES